MADDQPAPSGAAALRAQSKVPLPGTVTQSVTAPTASETSADTAPVTGGAALRAQSKVPLAGTPQGDKTAPEDTSVLGQIKGGAYQFGQGALEGLAGVAGLPALAAHGVNKMLAPLGFHPPIEDPANKDLEQSWMPSGWLKSAQSVGYDPTQQPKGLGQELIRGAGQATGTLPLAAFGGMGPTAAAAYTYGPALAGDLFHHFAPEWSPLWASLPAALTGTGIGRLWAESSARSAATAAAEKAAQEQAAATAARQAHEAGSADASLLQKAQTRGTQNVASAFKEGSEADVAKFHESEHAAADTHLQTENEGASADREAVAASLGKATTEEEGTKAMQDKAREWMGNEFKPKLAEAEKGMYYKPDGTTLIPEDALGDASHLKDSIVNSFTSGGEAEPITSLFRSRLPDQVNSKLDMLAKQQGLQPGEAPKFTFGDMRKIRSAIGDAMSDPSIISNIGAKKLSEMYRGINDDIRGAIGNSAGPEGLAQFDKFNKEATRLFGVAENVGDNIITTTNAGKETITPRMVADNGMWRDSTKVNQLRSEKTLSEGVDEVAASRLRTGKNTPGLDPVDAVQHFKDLPVPAKTALFGDDKAGLIQDSIDRGAAAETKAAEMKAAADKQRDQLLQGVKEGKKDIVQTGAGMRDVQTAARSRTGTQLRQAQENAEANTQAAVAKAKDLQKRGASVGGIELPFWIRNMPSLASGYLGGQHLLNEFGTTMPDWGNQLTAGVGAGAGYLASKGMRELIGNPLATRNLLVGATASQSPYKPDELGWSVEKNK
jgi:hypothetical protein